MNEESIQRILDKLDRLDEKLDCHLERIAKVEERTQSNTGFIKLLLTAVLTLAVGLTTTVLSKLLGK